MDSQSFHIIVHQIEKGLKNGIFMKWHRQIHNCSLPNKLAGTNKHAQGNWNQEKSQKSAWYGDLLF